MAEEVGVKLKIEALEAATTLKGIKQGMKDLNNEMLKVEEGSREFQELSKAIGGAKERIKDLKENTALFTKGGTVSEIAGVGQAIAGGFAAASGAAALLGANTKDIEKQMLRVQASIAIVEGIKSAIAGWESVQRLLNLAMAANPIGLLIAGVVALTGALAYFFTATEDAIVATKDYSKGVNDMTKSNEDLQSSIEQTNIKIEEQTGVITASEARRRESTQKFFIANKAAADKYYADSQKANEEFNKAIEDMDADHRKVEREAFNKSKEEKEIEYQKTLAKLKTQFNGEQKLLEIEAEKAAKEKKKKDNEEWLKKQKEADKKFIDELDFQQKRKDDALDKQNEEDKRTGKEFVEEEAQRAKEQLEFDKLVNAQLLQQGRDVNEEQLKDAQNLAAAKIQIENSVFSALDSIGKLMGAQSEEAIALQKGVALTKLAISTAEAIGGLTAASSSNPLNSVTFGAAGVAQYATGLATILANIAAASSLLNAPSPRVSASGGGGGGSSAPVPRVNNVSQQVTNLQTDNNGNYTGKTQQTIRAYVVERDITNSQQKMASIVKKSKIG